MSFFSTDGPKVIHFQQPIFTPGNYLTASATSRPNPTFTWTRLQGNGKLGHVGSQLLIEKEMEGFNSYLCNAWNTLVNGKVMCVIRTINFTVTGDFIADMQLWHNRNIILYSKIIYHIII